jgi:large subunit ribosomal protein L9
MKVKLILEQEVPGLGSKGDLVQAKRGYAYNYLIPQGLAKEATPEALRAWQETQTLKKKQEEKEKEAALKIKETLEGRKVVIEAKVGEEGKLFGSVGAKEIAETVLKQLDVKIDKKMVILEKPIKSAGEYEVEVKLQTDVKSQVKVVVEGERGKRDG